jgi:hypothetical protein
LDVVVYRESNDFGMTSTGQPNAVLRRAESLTNYLSEQLRIPRQELCGRIGLYWQQPQISNLQPHNLVGHAFRSIVVTALERFGGAGITYEEEVSPTAIFPGFQFTTRSQDSRIDIVARRGNEIVALMSTRWRYRHDRVDVVDEALAYGGAARRLFPACRFYAVIGEFSPNRLTKILGNCPPTHPNPCITAAVHFAPQLISNGLGENGRVANLRSLEWLIGQTFTW